MTKTEIKAIAKDCKAVDKLKGILKELRKQADKIQYMENKDILCDIIELECHLNDLRDEYSEIVTDMDKEEREIFFESTNILHHIGLNIIDK